MSNISATSAALIRALSADSESHFWALLASAIEVHQASFQEFPVETPMHVIGDGDFTLSVHDALKVAASVLKFTDEDSLNAVGTLLSAKHAALYNNRMFEIAVDKQIYGRFCPDAVPITRSEIGDHVAKLLPPDWRVQAVTTCAAYSKKHVNLPPYIPDVDYRTFDLGECVDYSRALVVLRRAPFALEHALVLVNPSVTFGSDGVPEWRHKYITSSNVELPRIEILE
jgi:hypothetical protein